MVVDKPTFGAENSKYVFKTTEIVPNAIKLFSLLLEVCAAAAAAQDFHTSRAKSGENEEQKRS